MDEQDPVDKDEGLNDGDGDLMTLALLHQRLKQMDAGSQLS